MSFRGMLAQALETKDARIAKLEAALRKIEAGPTLPQKRAWKLHELSPGNTRRILLEWAASIARAALERNQS